ncbi:MAG: hypothetical protein M1150_03320 [Patescibacteria group bacterium]|nr:hypothetical protein [Patescibacteria group bacterium]
MGKHKTKQQKILTELRQLKKQVGQQMSVESEETIRATVLHPAEEKTTERKITTFKIAPNQASSSSIETIAYNYSYVYSDLKKITLLASLAIGFEVVLSLIISQGYDKLILKFFRLS